MDHSPIRQTFELGKFISTAGKSIINLVKLRRLGEEYRKMWKIQSCEVVLRAEKRYHFSNCDNAFPRVIKK